MIFVGTNAKGEYTDGVPEILDGQKGMIRYTFTKDNFSVLKEFKRAYFQLTDADGNRITFQDFTVDVLNNSDIDQGQVTLYVRLLDQLLSDFEKGLETNLLILRKDLKYFFKLKNLSIRAFIKCTMIWSSNLINYQKIRNHCRKFKQRY